MTALGLDVGIASIGWLVLDVNQRRVVDGGVYLFETPETKNNSGKATSNRKRDGDMCRAKRQTARRRERMTDVRRLLHEEGVLLESTRHALHDAARRAASQAQCRTASPWRLRAEALHRCLSADEWAVVLGHLAGHRAYFSNAKQGDNRNAGNSSAADKEMGQVSNALKNNDSLFTRATIEGEVETVGEWLSHGDRQRNRLGDYRFSVRREWVKDEANLLFARQRREGNRHASGELQQRYLDIAFMQLPVRAMKELGKCTFESEEGRAPRHCYSFELFRLLARLHNLKIVADVGSDPPRRLDSDQISHIVQVAQTQGSITYKTLRRELKLAKHERFDGVPDSGAEAKDVFDRKSGRTLPGTEALRKVVTQYDGKAWTSLTAERDKLDGIAAAISHHDDLDEIGRRLSELGLESEFVAALVREADGGQLGFFKGTGHLSISALRKLEPHLLAGRNLHDSLVELAKTDARYDPTRDRFSRKPSISGFGAAAVREWLSKPQLEALITSQTAARAVREAFKQALAIVQEHPDISTIHLEMAREVGKSPDARQEIELEQRGRERRRADLRRYFEETFKRLPTESEETRWALWKQQQGKCAFTGEDIHCTWVLDGDRRVQIEHILPRSRFRNESMDNQVLCLTRANQNKGRQTPHEWMKDGNGPLKWDEFVDRAKIMFKGREFERKLKNLLIVDASKLERTFKNRDLVDTRWIAKFLLAGLERLGTPEAPIRVQPVNAGLVGMLRHAWGLSAWKRDPSDKSKRRADDRHHALDAAVVATIDRDLVHRLTIAYQEAEDGKREFPARDFRPPWRDFRRDILNHVYGSGATDAGAERYQASDHTGIFVVRAETRRARGPVHKDTTYAVRQGSGEETAFEPLPIEKLEAKHLPAIRYGKDPTRLRAKLETWLALEKPADSRPTLPYRDIRTGDVIERPIRRVTIASQHKPALRVRMTDHGAETPDSSIAREGIVRVDMFSSPDGRVLCLPIYRAHLRSEDAPDCFFAGGEEQALPDGSSFIMSIYRNSYLRMSTKGDEIVEGYYRFFDRNSARLELWPQYTLDTKARRRVSVGTLQRVEKLALNRLGIVKDRQGRPVFVQLEKRTWRPPSKRKSGRAWRGVACT